MSFAQGKNITQIAKELKISRDTVRTILQESKAAEHSSNSIDRALHKAGLTHETITAKFAELMGAKDVRLATFEGKFTDRKEVADSAVQFRATEAVAKIAGMFPKDDVGLVAQLFVRLPDRELTAGHPKTCTCQECCRAWETIPNAEIVEP